MKSEEIFYLIRKAMHMFDRKSNIILRSDMSIAQAETQDDYIIAHNIGVKELVEQSDEDWSIEQAMIPIVGLFHEVCGHGGQIKHEFYKDSELSKVLALNHYACKCSDNYYGIVNGCPTRQYYSQPKEIAAQYIGVKCAYKFLSQEYSEAKANDILCRYVNYRIGNNSECIAAGKHYEFIDDVLSDFDREFRKQVYAHRKYGLDNNYDELVRYSELNGLGSKLKIRVALCQDGMKQDWMMASIYLDEYDKNDRIKTKPALKNINMSVSEAFNYIVPPVKPKPKHKDMKLDELYAFEDVLKTSDLRDDSDDLGLP